jgi:hypothetical protein
MYCFTNADTDDVDPFRFMLRRAYAEGTDLRMFVTPVHVVVCVLHQGLGIGERYEFWLKELVRINEEEAALAGKSPLPLWDFSDPNSITREPIPAAGDPTPMRWFWEHSHYRKVTGDLVLDRVLGQRAGAAAVGGFRGSADRDKCRRTHRARQEHACGLGLRQLRPGRADRAGGAKLEDAQPPRRSYLLVGAIVSLALPRGHCVRSKACERSR